MLKNYIWESKLKSVSNKIKFLVV